MTEKQFWMKLDQIAGNSDKITEFIRILRQGYFPMQSRRVSIPLNCLMRKKSSLFMIILQVSLHIMRITLIRALTALLSATRRSAPVIQRLSSI